jgi:hypothetical protein
MLVDVATHVAAVIAAVVAAERWVGVHEGEVAHQLRPRCALGSVESSNGERIDAGVLHKNGLFLQIFLCLSRACLGK